MSYIKFEHRALGDDRWLDLPPEAFVAHTWALDYCNEQATDGTITTGRAHRLVCPVDPALLPDAFTALVERGIWERIENGYRCPEFLSHGIAAEEQARVREKWAADKRRRRLHEVGNHSMCTPRSCRAAASSDTFESTGGQGNESTGGPLKSTSGQVDDPTRPDQTPKGSGRRRIPAPTRTACRHGRRDGGAIRGEGENASRICGECESEMPASIALAIAAAEEAS